VFPVPEGPDWDSNSGTRKYQFSELWLRGRQLKFTEGVKDLHSFEFDEAAEAFHQAQQLDPNFALAYWGEAMSYNHPLWAQQDLTTARKALERLPSAAVRHAPMSPNALHCAEESTFLQRCQNS
jgi:hypothetical protein